MFPEETANEEHGRESVEFRKGQKQDPLQLLGSDIKLRKELKQECRLFMIYLAILPSLRVGN